MSLENNEPKDIQSQVKEILSGLGDFLPPKSDTEKAENWGQLVEIIVAFKCSRCEIIHVGGMTPDKFLEIFAGKHAKGYFENFSAIGMFQAGQLPVDQGDIDRLLQKAEDLEAANEGLKKHFAYVQSLADEAAIKNSHLQVENDVLRRELDRFRPGREQLGETALDFRPSKKIWKFVFGIKREGQY